jgi:hypothetical protein
MPAVFAKYCLFSFLIKKISLLKVESLKGH